MCMHAAGLQLNCWPAYQHKRYMSARMSVRAIVAIVTQKSCRLKSV